MNDLLKSKTVWTGLAGLVATGGGYFTGDLTGAAAVQMALTALLGIFLRAGIEKNGLGGGKL